MKIGGHILLHVIFQMQVVLQKGFVLGLLWKLGGCEEHLMGSKLVKVANWNKVVIAVMQSLEGLVIVLKFFERKWYDGEVDDDWKCKPRERVSGFDGLHHDE